MKHKRYKIISPIIILILSVLLLININIKENFKINNAISNFADFYSGQVKIVSVDREKNYGKPVRLKINQKYLIELSNSKDDTYYANLKLNDSHNGKSFTLKYDSKGELFPYRDLAHLRGLTTISVMVIIVATFSFANLLFQLFNISYKKRYKNGSVASDKYLSHSKIYHQFLIAIAIFYTIAYLLINKSNIYILQDIIYLIILFLVPFLIYFILNYNLKIKKYYKFKFEEENLIVIKNRKVIFDEKYESFKFYTSLDKIRTIGSKTIEEYYLELIPYDSNKSVILIKLYNFDEESFKELKNKLKNKSYYDSMFNNGKYYSETPLVLLAKARNKILDTTLISFFAISIVALIILVLLYKYAKAFFIIALFSYIAIALILIVISIIFAIKNKYVEIEFKVDHDISIGDLKIPEEEIKSIRMTNPIYHNIKDILKLKISASDGKYSYSLKPIPEEEGEELTNESSILLYDLLMYEYGNFTTLE